jgi:hypothetical protein
MMHVENTFGSRLSPRIVEHFAIRGVKVREHMLKHFLYPIIINQSSWVGSKHVTHELPEAAGSSYGIACAFRLHASRGAYDSSITAHANVKAVCFFSINAAFCHTLRTEIIEWVFIPKPGLDRTNRSNVGNDLLYRLTTRLSPS